MFWFLKKPCSHINFFFLRDNDLYLFSRAAKTNYYILGALKQQKFTISQLQRLKVQNQGLGRAMIPLKSVEKNPSLHFPSSGSLSAIWGTPWLAAAALQSLPLLSDGALCIHVSFSLFSSLRSLVIWVKSPPDSRMTSS